jgi:hypothetical protein
VGKATLGSLGAYKPPKVGLGMSKLEAYLRQFRIVWHDGRCYAERDGVLYSEAALARLATGEGIAVPKKKVREVLYFEGARWENRHDLEALVLGMFPYGGSYKDGYGLFYLVGDGVVLVPSEGDAVAYPSVRSLGLGMYAFAGAGDGRRLDFSGEEADFWAYWEAVTAPLEWGAKVSAAIMLPVLLGQASGGWVFVGGSWGAQAEVFSSLIFLVWGRHPVPFGWDMYPAKLWSDEHWQYIAETGFVGVYKVSGGRKTALEYVASEVGRGWGSRRRVGMVCGASYALPPSEAPSLLRVPFRNERRSGVRLGAKVSAKEALALIQPKALMGAFRLFQRAVKASPPVHPVTAFSDWGAWALRYADVLGVREEVGAIFADYVRAAVADVSQLGALSQFFAAPQFEVGRKYTLRDVVAIGKLSDAQAKELERAMRTANGQSLLRWVLGQWGVRFTLYPNTATSPLYLAFYPLKEERTPKPTGRQSHPKRKKGVKKQTHREKVRQ